MELYLWAGLAIGLAWLGVGLWEWIIAKKSLETIWKNPDLSSTFLVLTILGMALTESAAIYWLIISFKILALDPSTGVGLAMWAGLAIWITWLWSWLGEWILVSSAMDAIHRNPAIKGKVMWFMILFLALVESSAIYWLVVAMQLLAK